LDIPPGEQPFHHLDIALAGCLTQQSPALMVKDIRIKALLQQKQADNQGFSPPDSMMKGYGLIQEGSFKLANSINVDI
jgi:hypothetical protein